MQRAWAGLTLTGKVLLITLVILSWVLAVYAVQPTEAQPTTEYEYAALVYEGDSAFVFTDELDVNSELNATLDSMGDDFNLVRSMNMMGERGWRFVDAQPAGAGVTLYLFERDNAISP
jgi:hypothetical protein